MRARRILDSLITSNNDLRFPGTFEIIDTADRLSSRKRIAREQVAQIRFQLFEITRRNSRRWRPLIRAHIFLIVHHMHSKRVFLARIKKIEKGMKHYCPT